MARFAEVIHPQWIAAPVDVVRARFADLDHHIHGHLHSKLRFEVLERRPCGGCFVQQVRLLGNCQRGVSECSLMPNGSIEDVSLEGLNGSGSIFLRRAPETVDGCDATRVEIAVPLPPPPVSGPLVKPLLEAQIRSEVRTAVLEDRADIDQRGYPRAALADGRRATSL